MSIEEIKGRTAAIEITTPNKAAKDLMQAKKDLIHLLSLHEKAIEDIPHNCTTCYMRDKRFLSDGQMDALCLTCIYNNRCNWRWRGLTE